MTTRNGSCCDHDHDGSQGCKVRQSGCGPVLGGPNGGNEHRSDPRAQMTGRTTVPLRARRPRACDLGLNTLGQFFIGLQIAAVVANVLLYSATGLSIEWRTAGINALQTSVLLAVWLNFLVTPGKPNEWFVAEVVFLAFAMVLLTNLMSPLQYGVIAMGFPYVDWWLAAADAALGVHVPTLAMWTQAHPVFAYLMNLSYFSLLPQWFVAVLALAVLREREHLWEFAFHFHFCLAVTVAMLLVAPAVGPQGYYHFHPAIDMERMIGQISGLHNGTMKLVRFDELEGLVSIPSFHVAGALLATWAFRRRRRILIPFALVNIGLIVATFMTGVHYVVDVLASLPLFACSVLMWRLWGRRWLDASRADGGTLPDFVVPVK